MNFYIVVPFYNEKKHIREVIRSLSSYGLHVVLVDDGSIDNYESKINSLKLKKMTLIKHKINLGKGAAMKTGAEYAFGKGADAVIFMDGDNQHKPEDLTKFVDKLSLKKYDAIFGSRNYNNSVPLVRFLGNKLASVILAAFFGIYVSDVLCGFKAFTRKAYKTIKWDSTGYGVETEMVVRTGKSGLKFCEVPVESIYHDKTKGVTILDAFGIMGEIIKWRLTL